MENGKDGGFADKFAGLALNDASVSTTNSDSLFQVMKAVEAAEATIKQQAEENIRLKSELQRKLQEIENIKIDESAAGRPHSVDNQDDRVKNSSSVYPSATFFGLKLNSEDGLLQAREETHPETSKVNGTLNVLPGTQPTSDNATRSQFSLLSPNRDQINLPGHGLMPMTEVNNSNSLWKQDLALKVRERDEEILQLRKQLAEYSIKEGQIRNEKYVLEKRIAYMRLAFDQQQQDLVDAASKALSYRQDIMEENIRLTYALQAAQEERTVFVSSLLPLLAEYSLQPPVPDAQSIVSNVKVLFKHVQEKLILTESKLKESQYQLAPWRSDVNHSNFAPQSPSQSIGAALATSNKDGLELVPQPTHSHVNPPTSSGAQRTLDWDLLGHHQGGLDGGFPQNREPDDLGRNSHFVSRPFPAPGITAYGSRYVEETTNKQVNFHDPVSNNEMDDPDTEGLQNERESPANWGSGSSPYTPPIDDPNSSYSYLTPVLEEPSSSYSEAADDDPLPAIDGLQISGEAYPGRELQACGYSINGTTSCNFEWVRHLEDGSVNYIDGAKQPTYLVTADDVETYLAIEVQPLDNKKRKGELVKVFANEHRKISCDPAMQTHVVKTHQNGHVSYEVSLSTRYLDIWESATLTIKREGYSIKGSGASGIVVTEKFSPNTVVTIPFGDPTHFSIIGSSGVNYLLRVESSPLDVTGSRDCIVLILRLFIMKAGERKKGKKRGLFFNKA
ncbi:hypothetical protein SLEP1_g34872 [Rubroshorea leprosula]|uniref:Uncharacterized protein n=1 Tax=Rubroshorea leprosula TaxID=152421 RepID=A0AAV5KLE7_9ROSI|nr:hypothetical protein SLEP1_g34872 [Rubroshorea leprosula]